MPIDMKEIVKETIKIRTEFSKWTRCATFIAEMGQGVELFANLQSNQYYCKCKCNFVKEYTLRMKLELTSEGGGYYNQGSWSWLTLTTHPPIGA